MWQHEINVQGPYDFERVLDRMSLDPLVVMDQQALRLSLPFEYQKKQAVHITFTGSKTEPSFKIEGTADQSEALQFVQRVLQLERGLHDIHDHFKESTLKTIFEAHAGTPLVLEPSPYSCLVKSVIHQQLNMSFAATLTERFVKTFGEQVDGVWFYPDPETVASIPVETLRDMQFSQRKAEYLIGIGEKISSGELDLSALSEKDDETVIKELVKIRGIGPWTAQSVLLFGFGRMDIFLPADIGIQNALKKHFQLDEKPALNEMEKWQKDWRPYSSYASLYLWRSIETGK
ncbi:DNA-3-methyladenine glycosylase family protein [Jeotgalibacillus haloalkalitolerans]|uniref:DNA-3-methyladenine glycosylase II n=1 Tax=Jeotgalibacillus haloalkalitolerans TaxID=3104292 RepID=A0ABU5KQL6_9BACL|nr:DNA-3-methyladenine glycosylase [Jeotgalibacillus sp. HH7-29]MDZ5713383.1 DNA-3-methyladenine glycosylase [Jeotgalibacillus sp. HH7-29]